jgi:hypothetical protein
MLLTALACQPTSYADRTTVRFDDQSAEGEKEADLPIDDADDTDPPDDTDKDIVEDLPEPIDEACYPGSLGSFDECLPVVAPSPMPTGYNYPAALNGDEQYREPIAFLDLEALDPQTALAANFALDEFAQEYKGRYAVVQPHAVERIQELRDLLGALVINSGYRNVDYNASVGGVSTSRHMYGDAFDIDPVSVSLDSLADACWDAGAGYVGVYATHIHCDWRDDQVDEVFYGEARRSAPRSATPLHDAAIVAGPSLSVTAIGWDEGEPLKEWTAFDAAGDVLLTATASTFTPPEQAVRVEVWVGRAIVQTMEL